MWIAVVAGSFGIGGVVLGVLLEPVKAIFARRVRARDERAERCARLIEAAVSARMYALGINRVHRFRSGGREVDEEWAASNQRAYNEARREIPPGCRAHQHERPWEFGGAVGGRPSGRADRVPRPAYG